MNRPLLLRLLALAALTLAVARATRAADPPDADNKAISLPPFLVEEPGQGPSWRYAQLPGFEFLARCNDRATRNVASTYYQLHQLLGVVLPEELQLKFSVPRAVILYDEELQPSASREIMAEMLSHAGPTPQIDDAVPFGRGGMRLTPAAPHVNFLPNLRLTDTDSMTVFTIVRRDNLDTDRLYLTADYVGYMLKYRVPALPAWFFSGFLELYANMEFRSGQISLAPQSWLSDGATRAIKNDPKAAHLPAPLREFFSGAFIRRAVLTPANPWQIEGGGDQDANLPTIEGMALPMDASNRAPLTETQAAQVLKDEGALFIRWALDEKFPDRRAALTKFVARTCTEPVTEKFFQECFGLNFAAAQQQLEEFLPAAIRRTVEFRLPKSFKVPALELRDASLGDIARIKGDWERLEITYVQAHFPTLAPKYLEQARHTLMHAYERDERDPRLLAVLGLCEHDAGNDAAAREFLESGARLGDMRPRAWLELGRLRLADVLAHPAGHDGQLNSNQVSEVLTALFAARKLRPPLPEVYELIAEAWAHSEFAATRAHLAVLDEGVLLFPRRPELIYQTADLYLQRGFPTDAQLYIDLGLRIAPDDPGRARFATLRSHLPAAPP